MLKVNSSTLFATVVAGSLLTACSTTKQVGPTIIKPVAPIDEPTKADYSDMYLRGTFNWWNAQAEYQLEKVGHQLYRTQVELTADGQYYEFVFADKDYNPGKNCGFAKTTQSIVYSGGSAIAANCSSLNSYFKFKPDQSRSYYFYFDHTTALPKVYIRKVYN